jgi:hypothetical protein
VKLERRELFALIPGSSLLGLSFAWRSFAAEDPIHILRSGDVERLRMDFNASRNKIRLFLLLSPT